MGRKDAGATHVAPVDHYRKQIGKQDYKKSKKNLKSTKAAHDLKKSSSPVKDTVIIVVTGLICVAVLYAILYWYLNQDPM